MTTSDKQFDSQFDKVENLVHYLWIGCNYASAPKRVLIMGELQFADGNKLPFYMIHHTAQYYSPQLWYDFLNKEIPEVVSFLGK